jgi:hypothetical protein
MTLAPATLAASDTARFSIWASFSGLKLAPSQISSSVTMITFTAGPASATINSWDGFWPALSD